jgi:hypothetical protein
VEVLSCSMTRTPPGNIFSHFIVIFSRAAKNNLRLRIA